MSKYIYSASKIVSMYIFSFMQILFVGSAVKKKVGPGLQRKNEGMAWYTGGYWLTLWGHSGPPGDNIKDSVLQLV